MKKFKQNILIKNIILLLITGGITKIIGMISKIILTRIVGINIISLYSVITPTYMLFISICMFSFPISISKLSADNKYDDASLIKNALLISIIVDIIIAISIILTSKLIARSLHNSNLYNIFNSIIFILPFVSTSAVLRGFLHGKENMLPSSISNIIEELIKIILIIFILPIAIKKNSILTIIFIILFNIITEFVSINILNNEINKKYISKKGKSNKKIIKDILSISIPTTLTRLVAAIGFFIEPIILTQVLLSTNYSIEFITLEYGIINSYVLPLLSVPSFITITIAAAILPNITKLYNDNKNKEYINKISKLLVFTIILGITSLCIIIPFHKEIIKIIYSFDFNRNYIYQIAPFFLFVYIQPILSSIIQSINKTNSLFIITIISSTVKYSLLYILGSNNYGINSLTISMIIGIIITTTSLIFIIIKKLSH